MGPDLIAPLAITMDLATLEQRPRVRAMLKDSAEAIARDVRARGVNWVWVDGFPRAGKSVFATKVAIALDCEPVTHLDNMPLEFDKQPKDSPRYADHMDLERIRASVNRCPVVVEGVCLRDVVDGMRRDAALCIYIAKVRRQSAGKLIWQDGVEMLQGAVSDNWLVRDVMDYHRRVRPHATSDLVLVRIEDAAAGPRRD